MNPHLIMIVGAVLLLVLVAALILRRRDPAFEQAVAEGEEKERVRAVAAARREIRGFVAALFAIAVAAAVAWGYLGFPTNGADAILAIKQVVTPVK